jgi:hypothetical protein
MKVIIDTRIRAFQNAKSLDDMREHGWQLAHDLGEMSPEAAVDCIYTERASWISPMLTFARRSFTANNSMALNKINEVLIACGARSGEVTSLPKESLQVAEFEAFEAIHNYDRIIVVKNFLDSFFHGTCDIPMFPWSWVPQDIEWLSSAYATDYLSTFPKHLQLIFNETHLHWHFIAKNGKQTND